jgi:hypothetical protein
MINHIFINKNTKKFKYFERIVEKIPEVERFDGIGGSPNCPRGNALVKNFSS